jgi:hypothetical protein
MTLVLSGRLHIDLTAYLTRLPSLDVMKTAMAALAAAPWEADVASREPSRLPRANV